MSACALNARRIGSPYRTYVLMGDGETAEGSVWEAAASAHFHKLDSLCAIVDVNALGQSRATELEHDLETYRVRWSAFGWHAIVIDGHDMPQILAAYKEARDTRGRPTVILARTLKGKGVSFTEGQPNWHGKPLSKEQMEKAFDGAGSPAGAGDRRRAEDRRAACRRGRSPRPRQMPRRNYKLGDLIATREAYGAASPSSATSIRAWSRSTPT